MSETVINTSELEYQQYNLNHPEYQYRKILPTSSLATVEIVAGGNETIFEVAPSCGNWSRSYIAFRIRPHAAVAGGTFGNMWQDTFPMIQTIELYSPDSVYPVRIYHAHKYLHMTLRHNTKFTTTNTNDRPEYYLDGAFEGLYKSGYIASLPDPVGAEADKKRPVGTAYAGGLPGSCDFKTSYFEPMYTVCGSDNGQNPDIYCKINLSLFKDSFFGIDKDIYFPKTMYLRIVWNINEQIYFISTDANNPSTGAAAFAGQVDVSNLEFFFAKETNQILETKCINDVLGNGLNFMIPYMKSDKRLLNTTSQNVTLKINPIDGSRLVKIYHSVYNATERSNTAFDRNNTAGVKVSEYYITLDNERRSQYNINVNLYHDYIIDKNKLIGSSILSCNEYYYNYLSIDNYANDEPIGDEKKMQSQFIDGKPVTKELIWSKVMTTANANFAHYTYAVMLKSLTINANGILVI